MIPKYFLIAGGTGRQGGAVVNALLEDNATPIPAKHIFVLTRNVQGTSAAKLVERGVNLVQGDLSAPTAIFQHLKSLNIPLSETAAFLAQAHGPTELTDATAFIDATVENNLSYLVYSSVDRGGKEKSDADPSNCKTFSDKFRIEKHLESQLSKQAHIGFTILRPTWFADNAYWGFPGKLCMTGWRENMKGKKMQVVTTKDIGRWGVEALLRPDLTGIRNTAISIASDELSFKDIDNIFKEETGQPVGVMNGLAARFMIWSITDLRTMFDFIGGRDYGADLNKLSKTVKPTTFRTWVRESVN